MTDLQPTNLKAERRHEIKDPLLGSVVDDRFQIVSSLGQGATSSVYKAIDRVSDQAVAIKILHAHLSSDDNLVARFRREAEAAKILTHPNIVVVHDYAVSEIGTPYLIMDWVDGLSLQQLLLKERWLPLKTAVPIFAQICAALTVAHQKSVVHRDLKPGNIMLVPASADNSKYMVKILDFGCAQLAPMLGETVMKMTQTGEMLGSLLYMSPEQCLDGDVDNRSDIYALGCVFYEAITGKPPLAARTAFETMNKQMSEMPDTLHHVRPDLTFPKGLEHVIFKAMAKQPAKRYQSVNDFMDEILRYADVDQKVVAVKKVESNNDTPVSTSLISKTQLDINASEKQAMDEVILASGNAGIAAIAGIILISAGQISHNAMGTLFLFAFVVLCAIALKKTAEYFGNFTGKDDRVLKALDSSRRSKDALIEMIAGQKTLKGRALTNGTNETPVKIMAAEARLNDIILLTVSTANGGQEKMYVKPFEKSMFWATLPVSVRRASGAPMFPMDATIFNVPPGNKQVLKVNFKIALILDRANNH